MARPPGQAKPAGDRICNRRRAGQKGTRAGLAQLVEQLICNQKVAGSIPATGAIRGPVRPALSQARRLGAG
jgi:hypothetical protein